MEQSESRERTAGTGAARIAYFLSHPIQYQTVVLRHLATRPEFSVKTFYGLDTASKGSFDGGFGRHVQWDIRLDDGHEHEFLPGLGAGRQTSLFPINYGIGRRLKEGRFELVWIHGWGRLMDIEALWAAKRLGLPVLMRTENWFVGSPLKPGLVQGARESLKHRIVRACDAFGYLGSANYDYLRAYGVPPWKLFHMPYAVDNAFIRREVAAAAPRRAALRRELGIAEGAPVVLFAAKFQPRKRICDLISAYRLLSPDGVAPPEAHLVLVGAGEEEKRARALAAETGWNTIVFPGFQNQSQLPRYYDLADIFVVPSKNEQVPVVVHEAMNAGCAVLVSDECGVARDLVAGKGTGIVFPAGDVRALADALRGLLVRPDEVARMKEAGLALIAGVTPALVGDGLAAALAYLRGEGKLGGAGARLAAV